MEYIFEDRALILQNENKSVLVATDLHIGYEVSVLERAKVAFPSQKEPIFRRMSSLISKFTVQDVYLIGDIKHSIGVDRAYNWREIPDFMERLSKLTNVTVIPGNHDGDVLALLPRDVELGDVRGAKLDFEGHKVGLVHGHAWPTSEVLAADTIIMGHNHPTVRRLKDVSAPQIGRPERKRSSTIIPVVLQTRLNRDCVRMSQGQLELGDGKSSLVILPSFNNLLTGVYVNRPSAKLQGPFFENDCASLESAEVYSTDGIFLGTIDILRAQFTESELTK